VAGLIRAQNEHGRTLDAKNIERKAIGKTILKVEATTVTVPQRIQVRKLLQKAGLSAKQGEELSCVPQFLTKLQEMADHAGGDAPKPERADTASLDDIRLTAGNEQLLALYNRREELSQRITTCADLASRITKRWPNWLVLKRLMGHATDLEDADVIQAQIQTIEGQRHLLDEPDPVAPLVASLTQLLRDELNALKTAYDADWQAGEARLKADANWQQLEAEQRYQLRAAQQLIEAGKPAVSVADTDAILLTLDALQIGAFRDRVAAMSSRFEQVTLGAAKLLEPEVQEVSLPCRTLKTEAEVDAWLEEVGELLRKTLQDGPVIV